MQGDGPELREIPQADHARLAAALMKRQAALSLKVGAAFVVLVFGLPLVNLYAPDFAKAPVFGFTLTWLFLGVVFFPITWALSAYFVKESNRIESELGASTLESLGGETRSPR